MDPIIFIIIIGFAWISLSAISRIKWFEVKNPEIGLGYALYRTTRLNNLITKIAGRGTIVWKFLWDIGIISGLGILFIGLIIFSINIPLFVVSYLGGGNQPSSGGTEPIAIVPVIPGITIPLQILPYFIVGIMIGAIAHEFAHGVAARVENVKLKSTGIFAFLLFFGAFVEPDEESLLSKSRRSQMRIMAAGALANMIAAGILIIILAVPIGFPLLISPFYDPEPSGALIIDTIPGNPASLNGIEAGYAIIGINTSSDFTKINNVSDFHKYSATYILANQTLTFHFSGGISPITLQTVPRDDNNSKGFIGIRTWEYFEPRVLPPSIIVNLLPYWIFNTLLYSFIVNLMLAMMNLLPVPFLDGDKLLSNFLGPNYKRYMSVLRYYTLSVLGINLILSFVFTGWQQL